MRSANNLWRTIIWVATFSAVFAFVAAITGSAQAQTLTVLHNFGNGSDGSGPTAGLIRDSSGNFYGTTSGGGSNNAGTVFRLNKKGKEAILHSFGGLGDGANPGTALTMDKAGNLYGTTPTGGSGLFGIVFKLSNTVETILYNFIGGTDGGAPSSLIRDGKGNLYGTAQRAGAHAAGTVFKLDTNNNLIPLYEFGGGADGFEPVGGVVRDPQGNLYGTTFLGGRYNYGTVFRVTPKGKETVLLDLGPVGFLPLAGLLRDDAGNLYGTTSVSAFKIDPAHNATVLHGFVGQPDGIYPAANLIQDPQGNLYGTTLLGGTGPCSFNQVPGCGIVFKIAPDGTETILHDFCSVENCADGVFPSSTLVRDAHGNLYGTAGGGGKFGKGTIFKLTPQGAGGLAHPSIKPTEAAQPSANFSGWETMRSTP